MWAMTVTVDVLTATAEDQREGLEREVLPTVRQLPGFRHGTWMLHESGRSGMGVLVFDDEAGARAAADGLQVGGAAGAGATVASVDVHEVLAEATAPALTG